MDNIIKNPTLIAVVAGVITFSYLTWKRKNNKKNKKNKKNKSEENNNDLIITGAITVLVWFIAYGYLNYKSSGNNVKLPEKNVPTYKLVKEISESPKSFTLMNPSGGITMPLANNQMPDVFIDNF
jgi:hypothetical protein